MLKALFLNENSTFPYEFNSIQPLKDLIGFIATILLKQFYTKIVNDCWIENDIIKLFEIFAVLDPKNVFAAFSFFQITCLSKRNLDNSLFYILKAVREDSTLLLINKSSTNFMVLMPNLFLDKSITYQLINFTPISTLNEINHYLPIKYEIKRACFFHNQIAIGIRNNVEANQNPPIYRKSKVQNFSLSSSIGSIEQMALALNKENPFQELTNLIMLFHQSAIQCSRQYFDIFLEEDEDTKIRLLKKLLIETQKLLQCTLKTIERKSPKKSLRPTQNRASFFNDYSGKGDLLLKFIDNYKMKKVLIHFLSQRNTTKEAFFNFIMHKILIIIQPIIQKQKVDNFHQDFIDNEIQNLFTNVETQRGFLEEEEASVNNMIISRIINVLITSQNLNNTILLHINKFAKNLFTKLISHIELIFKSIIAHSQIPLSEFFHINEFRRFQGLIIVLITSY